MHLAMKMLLPLSAALVGAFATAAPASAQTAYIQQVAPHSTSFTSSASATAAPLQFVPTGQNAPRSSAFVPTPETATPAHSNNLAQTLEIGTLNKVYQAQAGGNNYSNVGVVGGKNNNVAVLQGGDDLSNLALINTQGLSIGVIQPPGSAPINMLIARLPNGGLLIKR
jgi:hypothetical protein